MPSINTHVVQPRDTLAAIARANNTTVAELVQLNGLTNPNVIRVGTVLKLHPDGWDGVGGQHDSLGESTIGRVGSLEILGAAERRAAQFGASYATDAHARSPNPTFPAIGTPAGSWKCNMFAGDVVYDAGFVPPQYESGWYALSQSWPSFTHLFQEVPRDEARPGDILIIDRGATNDAEGGGHALVLTSGIAADGSYGCIAVKSDGAKPHSRNVNSDTAGVDANGAPYRGVVLRPSKRRNVQLPDQPVVDPASARAPSTTPLKKGMTGDDVKQLQQCLVKLGFLTQSAMSTGPGIFGDKTHAAVAAFQQAKGVPVEPGFEGVYGPKTQAALVAALAN